MMQILKEVIATIEQLQSLKSDFVELHVQIQELIDYIDYHESRNRRPGHMDITVIQEIKHRLHALQRNIGKK